MILTIQIPVDKTKEGKTVYFSVNFLDSYQFMSSSLAKLVNNLESLPLTETLKSTYPKVDNTLIRRKGVFPYSYFDSLTKLYETCLPPREAFVNDLTDEECSVEDYAHACTAWKQFECHTFGDYMKSYLHLDVMLLADVFEEFRRVSLAQDGLDPVHFVSLPGLSFLSAFKMTGETIHLLQDPNMYNMFERGIRGGLTFVNKHKVVKESYTTESGEQESVHLAYIDANNLYGSALSKPLPHSDFEWVEDVTPFTTAEAILSLHDEGEFGYLFEVDLHYPTSIHDKTADFPLAPESDFVHPSMFSDFMSEFYYTLEENFNKPAYKPCRKLLLTQYNKEHYIVHFVILKFYLKMGLQLRVVHNIIKFKQKRWLEPYITYNSQQRAQASNAFEKDFYKLKNNSLFGKTMEDVRKRISYKLVTDVDKLLNLTNNPLFHDRDIINEDIVGVHMIKPKVTLDKPIYVGQAVLDYSKLEMYHLFYTILPACPLIKKLQLVGGDTDSFFLAITTDSKHSLHDVFSTMTNYLDASNYPTDHPLFSVTNKAKLGCFKDETGGQLLEEMILLRPKMYSMKFADEPSSIKRAKGISRSIVSQMSHQDYRNAYDHKTETHVNMTILRSKLHTINTITFRKRALSAWEDKRVWLSANESLPHGHVDSPVPPRKRCRVSLPPSGDVV